jgi:4,5-DOPA dioxygenase extradiol
MKAKRQPAIFIGHGHPINAIQKNDFTKSLIKFGSTLKDPEAILVISAHWESRGTRVSTSYNPHIIYDFGNFNPDLFDVKYPAKGSPGFARLVRETIGKDIISEDSEMGLDHGAWTVLKYIFPEANVPVFQMSLDFSKPPSYHYELATKLKPLREKGLMILGSGNIVHNLMMVDWKNRDAKPYDWVIDFDTTVKDNLLKSNHLPLVNYDKLSRSAIKSIPSVEHFLPLLYISALQEKSEKIKFIYEGYQYAAISMRSFIIG